MPKLQVTPQDLIKFITFIIIVSPNGIHKTIESKAPGLCYLAKSGHETKPASNKT